MREKVTSMFFRQFISIILLWQGCFCEAKNSQQQYFQVKPQDVEVGQGGRVIISCQVGDRRGRVQWTKDGLTLGYDRSLPGFPRYKVLGSEETGEFSLEVVNATLEDDAIYECQVGPSFNNKPIRASARLNVMLPPTKIEIEGVKSGSRLSVRENEMVELKCVVHNAKPKATIVWFRENVEFYSENREEIDEMSPDSRITTFSTIKFRPTSSDNGVTWACEANHPALTNSGPLRTTVLLSVLHPPGPPEITGYIEGETIRLGQTVHLVCKADGGNPLAEISWYKNGIKVDSSYTTSGRDSSNTYSFLASSKDNNAKFRCESKNELSTEPLMAEIVLSVNFAPASVELQGPREARAGENLSYECVTSNSNPPATIQWIVDNVTLSSVHSRTVESALGGWNTHANLSVTVGSNDRNKIITCNVINSELNAIKTESAMLTVIYPPGPPQIQGLDVDEVLTAGSLKRITCTSISGNPLATLKWFNGNKELVSIYLTRDNYASAEVAFIPKGSDNGGHLRCEASNMATESPLSLERNLTVDFAPDYIKMSVRPFQPKAGHNATLVCETASSYPASTITWWTNGEQLEGATEMIVDGSYGGFVTSSHLQLSMTAQHHGVVITCDASNGIANRRAHDAITLSIAHKPVFHMDTKNGNAIELIEGSPATVNMTASANPTPIEYEWAKESPALELEKLHSDPTDDRLVMSGGVLNLTNVKRQDSGYYTISATNAEGTTQTKLKIDVLYAPRITDITSSVLVGQGEPALLECAVDANPLNNHTIRWERKNYDMAGRTKTSMGSPTSMASSMLSSSSMVTSNSVNSLFGGQENVGVVMLTVLNATAEDSGEFWCVASNGLGGQIARNASFLLVRHPPIIKKNPLTEKSAADPGETARLTCEARGVPNITFYWGRVGGQRLTEGPKYEMNARMIDLLTWRAEFLIYNVTSLDYGGYECIARNSEGTTRFTIDLDVKSRPEPPSELRVVNITHRAVQLEWLPGFHGGMEQYFRLRYKQTTSHETSSSDDLFRFWDVYPANANSAVISDLDPGMEYEIDVMSMNDLGESNFTTDPVIVRTSNRPPRGSLERERFIEELEKRGELPVIIIATVSGLITFLLLFVVILGTVCFFYKKKRKEKQLKGLQKAPSEGSASTGSTKSATMELYTSSYNETMSGGGETLSSISEKSCISAANHNGQNGTFPTQAYLMEDNIPYSRSTYLIDPPTSVAFEHHPHLQQIQPQHINAKLYVEDPMSLYSVVHKERKRNSAAMMSVPDNNSNSDSPCSLEHQMNYEDTESEYASELRRQTYLQKIGEHGGYSRNSHHPSVSSVYSTLPHIQMAPPNYQQQNGGLAPPPPVALMRPRQVRLSTDLDLDLSNTTGGHYTPLTTPIVIETNQQNNEGPICASSPKRTMSAFTTFGPSRSNVTTPMSPPNGGSPTTIPNSTSTSTLGGGGGGGPATGHLV